MTAIDGTMFSGASTFEIKFEQNVIMPVSIRLVEDTRFLSDSGDMFGIEGLVRSVSGKPVLATNNGDFFSEAIIAFSDYYNGEQPDPDPTPTPDPDPTPTPDPDPTPTPDPDPTPTPDPDPTPTPDPDPLSDQKNIESFSITGVNGSIDEQTSSIYILLPHELLGTNLTAEFALSAGANAFVDDVIQISGETIIDIAEPITYVVQVKMVQCVHMW